MVQVFVKLTEAEQLVDGKECWIKGKVLKAVGDINDIACMFQVKYEDEEENKDVTLYEDYKNNDLVVL